MRHIPLAGAISGIGLWAMGVWLPAYFIRVHGMGSGEVGTWMALIYGIGGGIGVIYGGYKKTNIGAIPMTELEIINNQVAGLPTTEQTSGSLFRCRYSYKLISMPS